MEPNGESNQGSEATRGAKPESPPVAELVPRHPGAPPRRRGRWGRRLLVAFLVAVGAWMMLTLGALLGGLGAGQRVREEFHSLNRHGAYKVAIISVEGVILDGESFVKDQIDQAMEDPDVRAVVLRVNSPGGTVTGSDYLYHHLNKLREKRQVPIVVSMGGLAASGGYYVSMAVGNEHSDTIFAEPTTWTGSIGVIIPHYNVAQLFEKIGVEEDSVLSHPLKGMGSFAQPMTEEERAIFQELVDESFARFKEVIRSGRAAFQKDPARLDELATGQIFTAQQAVDNGLVDRIGFVEEAIDRAIQLAGLPASDVQVVRYRREPTLTELLLGVQARSNRGSDLAAFLELMAPRAYYLCTRVPPWIRSHPY